MKKLLLTIFVLSSYCVKAQNGIPISGLSTYYGNPAGGWTPVVINGVTRKMDAGWFGYKSFDSVAVSYGASIDTFRYYNRTTGINFNSLYSHSSGGGLLFPNSSNTYLNGYGGFVALNTDTIIEGTVNKFFTNAKSRAAISLTTTGSSGAATYDSSTGVFNIPQYQSALSFPNTTNKYLNGYNIFVSLNTDSLVEGSNNLFFTNARGRGVISLTTTGSSGAATYDNSTGVFNIPQYSGGSGLIYPNTINKYLNGYGNFILLNTDSITEGAINNFYTNTRARNAISLATIGLASYSSSTGVLTIPAGVDTIYRTVGKDSIQFTIGGRYYSIFDSVGGSGGGSIGGSVAAGQVSYGTASNTIGSEAAFTYDAIANKLSSDSAAFKQVRIINASSTHQYPLSVQSNFGGYSGLLVQNKSASGAAATQIKLLGPDETDSTNGVALWISQLSQGFAGKATVIRSSSPPGGGFVLACDSCDMYIENGTPGVSAVNRMHIFKSTGHINFGNDGANPSYFGPGPYTTVRVLGSGTFTDTLKLCDNVAGGYATLSAWKQGDSVGYVRDAGLQFLGINSTNPTGFLLGRFDPGGTFTVPYYTNSRSTGGYTTKAIIGTNSAGLLGVQNIFDTISGSRNSGQLLFWNSSIVPTSAGTLIWDNTNRIFTVGITGSFKGKIITDSLRLHSGYLQLNDEGHNYVIFKGLNYGNNANYVEGFGYRFYTVTQASSQVDAFRIDSAGEIKIPQAPKSATSADSVMFWSGGNSGSIRKMTLNSLSTIIGGGILNYVHTIFIPTTGGTVNLVKNQYNIINPAGTLATLTVNLPSSPANNDVVYIKYTQAITTVTYGNGTVVDGITSPVAGDLVVLTYDSGTTSWY